MNNYYFINYGQVKAMKIMIPLAMLVLYFAQLAPGYCEERLAYLDQARPSMKRISIANEADFRGWGLSLIHI